MNILSSNAKKINKTFNVFKCFTALLLFVLLYTNALAENHKNFMFSIESHNTKAKVYLLGSVHVAKSDIYPLNPIIEQAFDSAQFLGLEADISKADYNMIMKYALYQGKDSLKNHLPDSLYTYIKDKFTEHHFNESIFKKFKPWFAISTLTMLDIQDSGFTAQNGIDMHFLNKKGNKKLIELESIEYQLQLLASTDAFPDKFLEYSMADEDNSAQTMDKLFAYWQKGDTLSFKKLSLESADKPEFKDINNLLINERNKKMAEKIEEFLKTDNTFFIVVGSAHIIGDYGIIPILNSKGKYKIKQL